MSLAITLSINFCPEMSCPCYASCIYVQMYFRLQLIIEANTMNPDQTAPLRSGFFLNKAIGIINFAKLFQNFIDDSMICFLNSKLDLNLSCAKDFRNLISMVTWCIN